MKVGSGSSPLKNQYRPQVGGRNVCFISDQQLGVGWGRADACSKADSPNLQPGARAFIDGGRGYMQKQHSQLWQSSWTRSSMVWPALSWCFQMQLIFSSRVGVFPFLEVRSQNCGCSCLVYSLVSIVNFFALVRVSVSTRQLMGYGSEYYL